MRQKINLRRVYTSPQKPGTHLRRASEGGRNVYAAACLRTGRLRSDLRTPLACFAYFAALLQRFRLLMSISWLYHGQGNPRSSFVRRPYCVRSSFARRPFILHSSFSRPPSLNPTYSGRERLSRVVASSFSQRNKASLTESQS